MTGWSQNLEVRKLLVTDLVIRDLISYNIFLFLYSFWMEVLIDNKMERLKYWSSVKHKIRKTIP